MSISLVQHPVPLRPFPADWLGDKGRKYEPFDGGKLGNDQRSLARALRLDRKR
jgi:hypothetical protein